MNTNCLEGMACPKCQSEGPFWINAKLDILMHDDGHDTDGGDTEWDGESACTCKECQHGGTVADFRARDYTVILLYPDYCATDYGQETWCETVAAHTPVQAIRYARDTCQGDNADILNPDDLFVIAVFPGKCNDLNPGI